MVRIGVYVCHCGVNIAGVVNVRDVAEYAKKIPNVTVAKDYIYLCSDPGQQIIKDDIRKYGLDRVVVASCSPRMHEETFRKTVSEAGLNPYLLEAANLREQCSWCHSNEPGEATEKAKKIIEMGVARANLLEPLEKRKVKAEKSVLVIGGGIAGIQASLDLADLGFEVYLVEKSPSIGGKMAQLDKTFPTLDCSACILTPKMVECFRHPNITLLTYSEVQGVSGSAGNFTVKVLKKPRFVDEEKCTGCGICAQHCPAEVPNEFDMGLGVRKAIYIPFPQAVPLKYTIDEENCLKCELCEKVCEAEAINLNQQPETVNLVVGAIIVAVGFEMFDARKRGEYGYGRHQNVLIGLEFERLLSASGPTGGNIVRLSDGRIPRKIAFIQCVGCRDSKFHEYCCRIGCIAALKHAILAKEKLGKDADVYICFDDMRAFGKGYEEFYKRARDMDVKFIGGLPSEIRMSQDGSLYFDVYDSSTNKLLEVHADIVVLAAGLVPGRDFDKLQTAFRIPRSPDGFFLELHPKLRPLDTSMKGIFLAGTCQGPKDIPDTVSQASGAAMKAAGLLVKGEIEIEPLTAVVNEEVCGGCGICEPACPYDAITMKTKIIDGEEKMAAEVVEVACQGCGSCGAACPSGAIKMQHFTDKQILAQVYAALS